MGTNAALAETSFQRRLAFGQIAETAIAQWIMRVRGGQVLPIYDIEYETGKGPRIFSADGDLVAPDLLVFSRGKLHWIEAKHKSVFSWYRKKQRWETGIDLRHYHQYLKVRESFSLPVWLLFLHRIFMPSPIDRKYPDCPESCPVGLYGNDLDVLQTKAREDLRWARGMVYWGINDIKLLATLDTVIQCSGETNKQENVT